MEKGINCRIEDKGQIKEILELFTPCLESLRSGRTDITIMSEKLWRHGNVLIYQVEGKMIGFAAFYSNDFINHTAFLSLIAVLEEWRGKGIAKDILEEVINISRKKGMKRLRLEVNKANVHAIRFYTNRGMVVIEENETSFFMESCIYAKDR